MSMLETLLSEFDQETMICRKFLERAPQGKFDWKPHEKSMTIGQLINHLVEIPNWTKPTLETDALDLAPKDAAPYEATKVTSAEEALKVFDAHVSAARPSFLKISEADLTKPWSLLKSGTPLLTMPKGIVLRNFILNHMVHHRAQLGVYYRLNDIPVPSTYGPSADEGQM